jgi:hypothetical protein
MNTITKTEVQVPEGAELIDDVFYVWETRYGLYSSMTKKGRSMMSGATKEGVTILTRWHLKCEQEGWPDGSVSVVNTSVMTDL